jgi:hypothetical protein
MTRLLVALLAAAGLIVAVFASATPAFAEHTGPLVDPDIETYDFPGDNPDCDDLVDDGFIDSYDDEDKFDPGTTSDGEHSSIVNTDEVISFEADEGWLVVAAIIKGGNEGAAVYVYADGVDHDNGLTTPTQQGVSHVTLCLIEDSATPTPTPATPTPTPEGSQAGGTGTPAPSVPDTATSLPGMAGPLATVVFGLILLGSLGALAYANVSAVRRRS